MAEKSAAKKGALSKAFTKEERDAMRENAQELKASSNKAEAESAVLSKISEMSPSDRVLAQRVHEIVKANAPGLAPKTSYGMPAYAKGPDVVYFFQSADKFKTRCATLGFSDEANLDDGHMWPTAFALKELAATDEARIAALLKRAVR